MSFYRVYEIDNLYVGELNIQQSITSTYPSAGTVLYTNGTGGTFWSTAGGGASGSNYFSLSTGTISVSSIAFIGILFARVIAHYFLPKHLSGVSLSMNPIYTVYKRNRLAIILLFVSVMLTINITNIYYGIYKNRLSVNRLQSNYIFY
jgi:hypothetical protein